MSEPLNNQDLSATDPLAKWMSTFQVVYALTHQSVNELSTLEPGMIRKESGEGLLVRKITAEMLRNNLQLAGEIHGLALAGHLGYSKDNGRVQFRQDIAEKIGVNRAFKVMTEDPDVFVDEQVDIEALDADAYASLHILEVEDKPEEKEKELEKKHQETEKTHHSSTPTTHSRRPVVRPEQQHVAVRQLAERMLEQLRTNEKNRHEQAVKVREADKKRERDAIKADDLKREIIATEIKTAESEASYQRADRTFGDQNENLTSGSNRSTVDLQEGSKVKESKKQKAADIEAIHVSKKSKTEK